jgi:hypothetical protein
MSQWLNLACHELGQGITMLVAAGETVKPGQFGIGQIRGIPVGIPVARGRRGTALAHFAGKPQLSDTVR